MVLLLVAALPGNAPHPCLPSIGGWDQQYTREQLVAMYPGYYFFRGPSEVKKAALTFDDGPDDRVTPRILDILKENSVHGTFFLIGSYARRNPDMVRRIVAEGHIIGNHTWSHSNMLPLNAEQDRQEIVRTGDALARITGRRTALLRPPRGKVSATIMDVARKEGYRVIGWSVDSVDWQDPQTSRITARLRDQMHPGAIILMHSVDLPTSNGVTVKVLPGLIKELKARGYELVTLDELLQIPAYTHPDAG
ncbi:MAG: polysaccharide deacetylase family protein [Peptococcaceae bacterium]|jgi:delta-lactam-biosynthetic de-N-acetylase|nr:polysaccharide deacetylase family protein [Peptococcaceae bacterium]